MIIALNLALSFLWGGLIGGLAVLSISCFRNIGDHYLSAGEKIYSFFAGCLLLGGAVTVLIMPLVISSL